MNTDYRKTTSAPPDSLPRRSSAASSPPASPDPSISPRGSVDPRGSADPRLPARPHSALNPSSSSSSTAAVARRRCLRTVVLGQVISLLLTGTSVFTSLLVQRRWNIPVLQNILSYALLAFHLVFVRARCGGRRRRGRWSLLGAGTAATAQLQRPRQQPQREALSALWEIDVNDDEIDSDIAEEIDADFRSGRSHSNLSSKSVNIQYGQCDQDEKSAILAPPLIGNRRAAPTPAWRYLAVAVADVMANYLIVKAYQDTSLASAMLLDCFALPCCAVLSFLFLDVRYSKRHLLGVLLCVVGLGLNVLSDALSAETLDPASLSTNSSSSISTVGSSPSSLAPTPTHAPLYPNALRGDILVIVAASLYAVSNVAQERLVKSGSRVEFLGMLGSFGTVLCGILLATVERDELSLSGFDAAAMLQLAGFVLCLFSMYCVTSKFLQEGDALLFNLSTLTSDVYGVAFQVFLFHSTPHWLYGVAFVSVLCGVLIYGDEPIQRVE
jgi:drug/metabolite transporter (DMT)-like permease